MSNEEVFKNYEKPILMLDELLYPDSLYNLLKKYIKEKKYLPIEFGKDCIRVMVLSDINEERLHDLVNRVKKEYISFFDELKVIICDVEELEQNIKDILSQIENGISEDGYYDWFIRFAFHFSQLYLPTENDYDPTIKKGYLPVITSRTFKFENGLYSSYILFCSNGSLANEVVINEVIKKADESISKKLKKKNVTNKIIRRNPIDHRLRHEVFKRDNYKCKECGASNKECCLHVDHILPVSQGGTDELDNLQTLCQQCNLAKSNKKFESKIKEQGDINGIHKGY